ncbi:OmpA family protein [Bdellovibrio bacteriovorus]
MKVSLSLISAALLSLAISACATKEKPVEVSENKEQLEQATHSAMSDKAKSDLAKSSKFSALSQNIRFDSGSAELTSSTRRALDELAGELKKSNEAFGKIRISGLADPTGIPERNQILSEQRAEAVRNYLVSKGIAKEKFETRGLGAVESDRMASASEHARDRRVDFEIVE